VAKDVAQLLARRIIVIFMEKPYILQHKNAAVAVLMIYDAGDITDIGNAVNKPYLPVLSRKIFL